MIPVLRTRSHRTLDDAALVLRALEIPFEAGMGGGLHELRVGEEDAARASRELVEFLREEPLVPARLVRAARRGRPLPGALVYVVVVCVMFQLSTRHLLGVDWLRAGVLDADAVRGGEWWRAITALTLHSGIGHLASNVIFGALFGALLAEATGNGLGWLLTLLSGAVGNVVNVVLRGGSHYAVGASTAIFGAVGALAAHELARGWTGARDMTRRWAPLVGGVILLGFLGAGGENTDVLAHVTGFASGAALGVVAAKWRPLRRAGAGSQAALATAALLLVAGAWAIAVRG